MKEQTPDAQPENSAHGYTEGAYVQEHLSSSKEHLSTSKPESGVSPELTEIEPPMGDFILKQTDIHPLMLAYGSYYHYSQVSVLLNRLQYLERAKQAELVEEHKNFKAAIADTILEIENKFHAEQAENARLKAECSSHEKERYEIYSFDSSQVMEIKALQKELEQIRSERDKMREALKGMEYERARVRPATHDTIVLEWDEKGNVTYCRTFDFPNDEVNARAAIASVGLNKRRYIIGEIDGILHLSKFKEDE